jgi:hypothetical protein
MKFHYYYFYSRIIFAHIPNTRPQSKSTGTESENLDLYFQRWEVNPLQTRLVLHVCTCSVIPASERSTSVPFLELPIAS